MLERTDTVADESRVRKELGQRVRKRRFSDAASDSAGGETHARCQAGGPLCTEEAEQCALGTKRFVVQKAKAMAIEAGE